MIDPIDGTKNYVRGVPIWATLIALMEGARAGGRPGLGAGAGPALVGRLGHGAYAGRHTRPRRRSRSAAWTGWPTPSFCYSTLGGWEEAGRLNAMLDLTRRTWRQRAYGDFYGYMLLAEGAVDIMVEPELSLWDLAALVPIVTEAGGTFTDLQGQPGPGGGSAIATNGHLHEDVLTRLSNPRLSGLSG